MKRKASEIDVENENSQPKVSSSKPMTLKTSDRRSCQGLESNLKIVSWNINGIRAWLTAGGCKYIEKEDPDIITFQELKCDQDKIPREASPSGYKSFWLSGDQVSLRHSNFWFSSSKQQIDIFISAGYSGVGLLTKIDPIDVKFGIGIEEHDREGRVITAEYSKFYLVTSYVPNSGRKLVRLSYRREFNRDFHRYLKDLEKKKPVIWCGDLNVAHQTIDLTNPKTNTKNAGFTKEEREDFSSILADGFIDSFRYLYPDERDAFTFWAYFRNARARNIGWRLDYFLLSSSLRENLCDFVIQTGVFGSDHCPIVLLMSL